MEDAEIVPGDPLPTLFYGLLPKAAHADPPDAERESAGPAARDDGAEPEGDRRWA